MPASKSTIRLTEVVAIWKKLEQLKRSNFIGSTKSGDIDYNDFESAIEEFVDIETFGVHATH